jgi:hypothetical protein
MGQPQDDRVATDPADAPGVIEIHRFHFYHP